MTGMKPMESLAAGLVGAGTLTAVHETARRLIPHAPRVDVIGKRAIAKPMRAAGWTPPDWGKLYGWALAGELASNSLYYALVGAGSRRGAMKRGLLLGLVGGLGAVFLPRPVGLGRQPGHRTPWTQIMTVMWYVAGGVAAAGAAEAMRRHRWI